jgi:hypothetical protein
MVVFGFGRGAGTKPLLREPREFLVSLIEHRVRTTADHTNIAAQIERRLGESK